MNYARYAAIHARHLPDKICLVERTPSLAQRRTLSWRAFNQRINRVANYLSAHVGLKQGDYVLHLQNNSLEWLVSYYAIIKLGGIVVPLSFRFVESDILHAASVCSPKLFVFGAEFLPLVVNCEAELATIESYMCVGQVPERMATPRGLRDYGEAEVHADSSEALVELGADHGLAMMFT
ncbi:MAG: AMP-binding protein, partial [Gammaproteobacteria bacterium]